MVAPGGGNSILLRATRLHTMLHYVTLFPTMLHYS